MSFNGRILNHLGGGAEESGGYYSKLLEEYDGIVSSSNFYTRTSNLPVSHETGANQPLQIVITKGDSLHIPDSISKSSARIVVLAEKPIIVEPESEGVEVVVIEQMNLRKILDYCGQQGLCSVILDIRGDDGYLGDLLGDGLNENLVQKVVMELCPVLDRNQESSILTFGKKSLSLKDLQSRVSNDSVIVEGYIS